MGSESSCLYFFAVAGCKSMNFAAPFVGKLKGHVTQSADADDTNPRHGRNVVGQEWVRNGDSAAKERPSLGQIERIRDWTHPGPLSAQPVGKTTMASDDGALATGAKVVMPGQTFATMQTTGSRPSHANAL